MHMNMYKYVYNLLCMQVDVYIFLFNPSFMNMNMKKIIRSISCIHEDMK